MSIKREVYDPTENYCEVFKIGVISEDINMAIKKKLSEEKEDITDIDDAVCIIVIDKKNRHSILTSQPMYAMQHGGVKKRMCYLRDKNNLQWLYTCKRTSGGDYEAAFKECCHKIPPCPSPRKVDLEGPCPCPSPETSSER